VPRYVLVDAALWQENIDSLWLEGFTYRSLFRGTAQQKLYTVAPYLVDISVSGVEFIKEIVQQDPVKRRVTWLHSELSIDDLRKHLRRFLRMKTKTGMYIYSRFYDPYVADCVFPNLTSAQLNEFFAPIEYLITEDVRINERCVFYLSADKELRIKYKAINYVDNK